MKLISVILIILFSTSTYSQDTIIITARGENIPLQAVVNIEASKILYAGQEYTFVLTTSGHHDIHLTAQNAKVQLMEDSKKSTDGLRYNVTPIDTGTCSITISNQINEKRIVNLTMQMFSVINFPIPPIQIGGKKSGEIIHTLKDNLEINCSYPQETGINDRYEVTKWEAKIGEKTFSGNGTLLSNELIKYINQANDEYIHFIATLAENKTGHFKSEAIYLIRKNEKSKK